MYIKGASLAKYYGAVQRIASRKGARVISAKVQGLTPLTEWRSFNIFEATIDDMLHGLKNKKDFRVIIKIRTSRKSDIIKSYVVCEYYQSYSPERKTYVVIEPVVKVENIESLLEGENK